ncbi:chromodomain protein-2 [Diaporthe eres]|uniref:Chromo domain-containing protein n=1 Tax=Diaporthe vaccinii TaxID=105482 RepID=A0ABR4DZK7_9PEZI|nr:chromodomain protein-2 [Diaporthe eres]
MISAPAAAMEDLEAGWERFRSDIRGSSEVVDTKQEKPILQFHIPIRPRRPKYRPGSGPAPPRINLRPVHDSDAFIVDKVVLPRGPFHPSDHIRQRRCYYIVGWPDLPAARPVVDASKILDYVSPRTLEDWEYQDALRREEERDKAREAKEREVAEGKEGATPVDGGPLPGARRRPGRPPRAMMMVAVPTPEPELNSEQEETIHKRMRGPSLSTPQKSRVAQLVAEEEMLEELEGVSENAELGIHRRPDPSSEDGGISGGDVNMGVVEDLDSLRLSSAVAGRSSRECSRASSAKPAFASSPASLAKPAASVAVHRAAAPAVPPLTRRAGDRNSSSPSRSSKAPTRPQVSTTPIPLPSYYSQALKQRIPKSHVAVPSTYTGLPGRSASTQSDQVNSRRSSSANPPPSHTNGFTPIGGTFSRPPKRPAEDSPVSADPLAKTKSKKSKNKQAKLAAADAEVPAETADSPDPILDLVQGEQDYVVKRLEGDYVLDGVHWFKVRWEGDWPEDQNPTWEPRENIAERLVKQYLKRRPKRGSSRLDGPKSKKQAKMKQTNLLADWAKGCSSVADAFEGEVELNATGDTMLGQGNALGSNADADDGPDELLVIDENETAATERRKAMEAQIVAQFASIARAAPQHF